MWEDINLDADELTMGRQLQRVRHQLLHREPKTATSDYVVLPLVDLSTLRYGSAESNRPQRERPQGHMAGR